MRDKPVQIIRCDNAGENLTLQQELIKDGIDVTFEFVAPHTPQHNGVAERAFATFYGRMRAMMFNAGLTEKMRGKLCAECASLAAKLDNIIPREYQPLTSYQLFYGKE